MITAEAETFLECFFLDLPTNIYMIHIYLNWHILQIESNLKEIFAEPPILTVKRHKILRGIIGGNKVFDNKRILNIKKFNKGKCEPCFTRSINLCCKQLKSCSTFQSAFRKSTFLIRYNVTYKSSGVIYLMECCLCEKSQ